MIDLLRLYHAYELSDLPRRRWMKGLGGRWLQMGTLAALYGPPGAGKSFLSIDWACRTAAYDNPHGGWVLYIATEGGGSLDARIRAWCQANGKVPHDLNLVVLTTCPDLTDENTRYALLVAWGDQIHVPLEMLKFIVADTLANTMGGEENDSERMKAYVGGCRHLSEETGATILVVHHTNASGERERGHSALRGGVDTLIRFENEDDIVAMTVEKQKDGPSGERVEMVLNVVTVLDDKGESLLDDDGEPITTCTIAPYVAPPPSSIPPASGPSLNQRKVLAHLSRDLIYGDGATKTDILRDGRITNDGSCWKALEACMRYGWVSKDGTRYYATEAGKASLNIGTAIATAIIHRSNNGHHKEEATNQRIQDYVNLNLWDEAEDEASRIPDEVKRMKALAWVKKKKGG